MIQYEYENHLLVSEVEMERKLSKAEQEKLMWMWNEDSALQLIYRNFEDFVFSHTGYRSNPNAK